MITLARRRNQAQGHGADEISTSEERDYTVRAVERVCSILNLLQESIDGVSLIEVGQATELPKSSAFRYLWTLEVHRYVERDEQTGLYRLGLGFVGMQSRHLEVLRERARPWLEELRDDFEETTNLGILDGDHVIYVDIVESRHKVRLAASRGDRDPLHSTALGKAIASQLPDSRVRDLLDRTGMERQSDNTITSIDAYMDEIAKVRRLGYAVDNGENAADGRCIAAPLLGTHLPAALSISAPAARFTLKDVEKAARKLLDVAEQITTNPATSTETDGEA
ncbi:IclR family transcriptional regulator, acetate operon repressor [Prauserella marina]|uniref:IclR family transcriptional regulator, acetate operon repressor n=1 Tax=Prauserella marina TaxID=530584 RepID=A0A1G6UJL9_9PSEU|nr:IclR family transcriptional regulator [Prauserella marina]SDD41459.1 IclR family transcriptional regulator, acetate operon repressor [Prauserella marina]